jgi:hypothetical protein
MAKVELGLVVSFGPQHPRSAASMIVDRFHMSDPPLK